MPRPWRGDQEPFATRAFPGGGRSARRILWFAVAIGLFLPPLVAKAGTPAPARTGESANVLDYGADPTGAVASDAAFAAALASKRHTIHVPEGTYSFSAPVRVPSGKELRGESQTSTVLSFMRTATGVQIGDGGDLESNSAVRDIQINGAGETAFKVNHSWQTRVENVSIRGHWTDGFVFIWTWGSSFANLTTADANISNACFSVGAAFNANFASNWYTSTFARYNFLFDFGIGRVTTERSGGNHFAMLTAQGGEVGFYLRQIWSSTFQGLYTENVVLPVKVGDKAGGGEVVTAITIAGGALVGPSPRHPKARDRVACFELDWARGMSVTGLGFSCAFGAGNLAPTTVHGDGTGATAVSRVTPDGVVHSIEVLAGGKGYSTATVSLGGAGSGAAANATVRGGKVLGIAVSRGGTGYSKASVIPAAIRYNDVEGCVFSGCYFSANIGGVGSPLYPYVVRTEKAVPRSGIRIVGDVSLIGGGLSSPNSADLVKSQGAQHGHFVIETETSGARVATPYLPPQFP